MSHQHLQRVVVRMLYDPLFAAQVFADPTAALAHEDLTAQERDWLVSVDQRAYAVDPLRRTRLLATLLEEFPVTVHHLVQQTQPPVCLEDFFATTEFHACIQQRGSLAVAFGAYLCSTSLQTRYPDLNLTSLVQIEGTIAQLRRQRPAVVTAGYSEPGSLTLAPLVRLLTLPAGLLAHYHLTHERLNRDADGLVAAVCKPSTLTLPPPENEQEWLLMVWQPQSDSATVEVLPEALGQLLATVPAPRAALLATACALGAASQEAEEILDDLLADGVLQ